MPNKKNILVCQHGARHRYAIPRMLQAAGMLSGLYTDSSSQSLLGKFSTVLGSRAPSKLAKLGRRKIVGVPAEKVKSSDVYAIREQLHAILGRGRLNGIELFLERHRLLSHKMKKLGTRDANTVYSMYYENLDFLKWAKSEGCKSIVDVYISPLTDQIMHDEIRPFKLPNGFYDPESMQTKLDLWREAAAMADVLLCPSEWVAEGVRKVSPEAVHKVRVVPYGCSIDYAGGINQPKVGKVLFAGSDVVRKGIYYLAQSASELQAIDKDIEIQIAGSIPEAILQHPLCNDLKFLGQLSSDQMTQAYLTADMFVLPSLSEGYAGVVAEAISAGCPVIVTKESGSPVLHEREGLIVPARDSKALTAAILRMFQDRDLRDACAKNCLEQVSFYKEEKWSERLIEAIRDCL